MLTAVTVREVSIHVTHSIAVSTRAAKIQRIFKCVQRQPADNLFPV